MDIEDDETLEVYVEECLEHLADIENDLLAIEEAGADIDEELVNKVYRAAHSIKGGAGFMGLTVIKELTHEMENILGMIRSREMVPDSESISILLSAADTLNDLINNVKTSNEADISTHMEALRSIIEGQVIKEEKAEEIPVPRKEKGEDLMPGPIGKESFEHPIESEEMEAEERAREVLEQPVGQTVVVEKDEKEKISTGGRGSLRVNVGLLDSLMTLAGELVLGRNQLLQSMSSDDQRALELAGQRVNMITSELQEAIMLTRMQPIGNIFNKFSRIVRDLSNDLGKETSLTIEGKDVELDKTIVEGLNDPLTHLIRNAVDHGIETPDFRRKQGKDPVGRIYLKAYHEAGQINIEIIDDGNGMDGDRIAPKAVSKGLIREEQIRAMSPKEKMNLIFLPGFSMADEVSEVSGRGVGMDVVKTNLDRLGGLVDIDSKPGKGSTIHIKLPLTLAIIPSLLVSEGKERYAIPQVNVRELLRIPASQVKNRIERVGNAEVVRLREKLLPLLNLADVLGIGCTYLDPADEEEKADRRKGIFDRRSRKSALSTQDAKSTGQGESSDEQPATDIREDLRDGTDRRYHAQSSVNIVVASAGAFQYGLVVDELHDSEEIVVKPLGRQLKRCKGYAGATILGDGRVALILDVGNLAQMAELTSVSATERAGQVAKEADEAMKDRQSLLLFRNAEDEQFAVPLELVERIEKIKKAEIEVVGGKKVIQYRGGSLPLFSIGEVAKVKPLAESETALVIVFLISGREVGLLATPPVDSVEVGLELDDTTLRQAGIMGSAIIGGYTTLMVNIFGIVEALNPEWFSGQEKGRKIDEKRAGILFAEDSEFFRNEVKGCLDIAGFNVIQAEDGLEAWKLLEKHVDEIALVLTDLEMPKLDGYALTEKIKQDKRFSHLPVIALTSLAGEENMKKGKAAGIDEYQIKLDRERLMESIHVRLKGMGI